MGKRAKVSFLKSLAGVAVKHRIIPTILTDGLTVVKGKQFDNWRTVGSAEATARLYASRDVDELMLLDVNARAHGRIIEPDLLRHFSNLLDIPFSVGGGINNLDHAKQCFRLGAEKIVLSSASIQNPGLITEIAEVFGNQAVIVALDFESDSSKRIIMKSGKEICNIDVVSFIESLEELGAGEILLQSIQRDGTLSGMDFNRIEWVSKLCRLPIIASGGAASMIDFHKAILSGASAVAAGAIFQFTEITPGLIRNYLADQDVPVRILGSII